MKKKSQQIPTDIYTPQERKKGVASLTGIPPSSGYAFTTLPMSDLLKDPKKAPAINAILEDLVAKTGIKVDLEHLPVFMAIKPSDVYIGPQGRPIVFLGYESKIRTVNKQKIRVPVGSRYIDLTTFEIIDDKEGIDPTTLQHDKILEKLQENAAELINEVLVHKHNKLVDFVCGNNNTPLQNITLMLNKCKRIANERIAQLQLQVESLSKPKDVPEGAKALDEKTKLDLGISHDESGEISYSPNSNPEAVIRGISATVVAFIIQYWDSPEKVMNAYENGIIHKVLSRNAETASEEDINAAADALLNVMRKIHEDWEESRAKSDAYEKSRQEPKAPEEKPDPSWVLQRIKPITADLVRRRSLVPERFKGFRAFQEQGLAASKSISRTEITPLVRARDAAEKTAKWLLTKSASLRKNGMTLSVKNLSPAEVSTLCQLAKDLQSFTEGYARPLLNEDGKIDKSKMGYSKDPIANMLVSSYFGLCQSALEKIACDGAEESMSVICGNMSKEKEYDVEVG